MHNNVQGHRNADVCKQTYDASCTLSTLVIHHDHEHAQRHCVVITGCMLIPRIGHTQFGPAISHQEQRS